jgi:hypothetical protein
LGLAKFVYVAKAAFLSGGFDTLTDSVTGALGTELVEV